MGELVSVIVAVYNIENFIKDCLDSLVCQTYRDYEIICIDDGSTDRSSEILKQYEAKYPRISVIQISHGNLPNVRNIGVSAAKGDYIVFVDGDDIVNEKYIETLMEGMDRGADLTFCGYKKFKNKEEVLNKVLKINKPKRRLSAYRSRSFRVYVWARVYKKESLLKFIGDNSDYQDSITNMRMLDTMDLKNIYYTNSCLYYYRIRDNSFSSREGQDLRIRKTIDWIYNSQREESILNYQGLKYCLSVRMLIRFSKDKEEDGCLNKKIKYFLLRTLKIKYISPLDKLGLIVLSLIPQLYLLVRVLNDFTIINIKKRGHAK